MMLRSGTAHVLEAIIGLFPSQSCHGFMYRAWDHVCLIWNKGCKSLCWVRCSIAVFECYKEHGQFPWEPWESLIAAECTSSKPTFPVLSPTGIWRSLALWCGMAVAFPVPRLSWVRAGRESANPQWAAPGWQQPVPTGGSAQETEVSHQWSET